MDRSERRALFVDAVVPCSQAPACAMKFGSGAEMREAPGRFGALRGDTYRVRWARLAWLLAWPLDVYYLERTPTGPRVVGRSGVLDFISIHGPRDALAFLAATLLPFRTGSAGAETGVVFMNPPQATR